MVVLENVKARAVSLEEAVSVATLVICARVLINDHSSFVTFLEAPFQRKVREAEHLEIHFSLL